MMQSSKKIAKMLTCLVCCAAILLTHLRAELNEQCQACNQTCIEKNMSESYTMQAFEKLSALAHKFHKKAQKFAASLDQEKIAAELKELGDIDDATKFGQVHLPLIKTAKVLTEPFGWFLNVQEGPYTAVDPLVFYFDQEKGEISGLIIIKRPDGTYGPAGGFTKYGETFKQTGVREAREETGVDVIEESMHLVGVYDAIDRDKRQHVASIAFVGLTKDLPQLSDEAREVLIVDRIFVEATLESDWFAKDHREMALAAFDALEQKKEAMLETIK
ncbi:MAG: NUDIX hydrolase [Epsilonproteobacteria bacterium]|nr:NUDIX hydrolase [Campylobacterota bacterium]